VNTIEKTVPVVHYREGTQIVIGECTATLSASGIMIEATIAGEPVTGLIMNGEPVTGTLAGDFDKLEKVEFPQDGLKIDDPQKHLHFVRSLAMKYHKASRTVQNGA
jgi:hypothetical protein